MNPLRFKNKRSAPPPNYQSRKVQMRLLGLVFAFMLVIAMAIEARDPAHYAWMWHLDDAASKPPPTTEEPTIDPAPRTGPVEQLRRDFLNHVVTSVSESERDVLLRRLDTRLDPTRDYGDHSQDQIIVGILEAAADSYFSRAFEGLSPDDEAKWKPLLVELQDRWSAAVIGRVRQDSSISVGEGAGAGATIIEPKNRYDLRQVDLLVGLRDGLEDEVLRRVKDNTMFERRESLAWRAMLRRAIQESEHAELIVTTRLQLAEQPTAYRGRAISVGGRVLRGYTVKAQPNPFEIETYQVLWLRPNGADHLPIAIYCLQLPAGFPTLEPLREDGNRIDEEVKLTGWFYKHWAYASPTGLSLAPLLVASSVTWYPQVKEAPSRSNAIPLAVQVLLAAAFAGVFTRFVYRWSRWSNVTRQRLAGESRIEQLTPDDLGPSVGDGLRQLERKEKRGQEPK